MQLREQRKAFDALRDVAPAPPNRAFHYANGYMLGYPKCCTDEFIERFKLTYGELMDQLQRDEGAPWKGTGFVPCRECRKRTGTADDFQQYIAEVITPNRKVAEPFPNY